MLKKIIRVSRGTACTQGACYVQRELFATRHGRVIIPAIRISDPHSAGTRSKQLLELSTPPVFPLLNPVQRRRNIEGAPSRATRMEEQARPCEEISRKYEMKYARANSDWSPVRADLRIDGAQQRM